jgi:uncharacterized protein (DUF2147 family)
MIARAAALLCSGLCFLLPSWAAWPVLIFERLNFGVSIMRARLLVPVVALLSLAVAAHAQNAAPAAPQSPLGLWQAVDDDTKQPTGWFLISNHDGVFSGIIAKMFLKPGEDPNAVCSACKDDRLNHPWLGLEIIRGMKPDPEHSDKYVDGSILDPRDGKIYHANMTVTPDGQTLVVRGYIGISLLGQNQYWTRLPDAAMSMLDPSVNPNPAVAAPSPANKMAPAPARKPQAAGPAPAIAAPPPAAR